MPFFHSVSLFMSDAKDCCLFVRGPAKTSFYSKDEIVADNVLAQVNVRVQAHLYKAMIDHGVWMEGSTLKP